MGMGESSSGRDCWLVDPAVCLWARVIACQANYYWVQVGPDSVPSTIALASQEENPSLQFLCTRRARLKKLGQQVLVGDRVQIEELDWQAKRGAIATIAPRANQLDRPPIANLDQILLVFALLEPTLDPHQLSRFLVKAESTGIPISLCLNKRDLVTPERVADWQQRLAQWGYPPLIVSVQDDRELMDTLIPQLQGRTTVVAGPSGVGKSSLINRLIPALDLRTGRVSGKLGRGRHTTRHVELFELPGGGFLADTPGFNQPDMTCTVEALEHCFPEIKRRLSQQTCQFNNCLHRDEPGCVVRASDTQVTWERYEHYLAMLDETLQYQHALEQRRDGESAEKVKIGESGQVQHEPKLEARKYRRPSRRRRHQALQDLRLDRVSIQELEDLENETLENLDL
jgi:ribosome biogenesis GTPase